MALPAHSLGDRGGRPGNRITGERRRAPCQGFTPLFDGKTLNGWRGDPALWSVRDGAITGGSAQPIPTMSFLLGRNEIALLSEAVEIGRSAEKVTRTITASVNPVADLLAAYRPYPQWPDVARSFASQGQFRL